MKRKGATLDDLTESIYDLGAMVSSQIIELRGEVKEIRGDIHGLQAGQREHTRQVSSLENKMTAAHNDIKELYSLVAA